MPPSICRGRSGRRSSISVGGVQPGQNALRPIWATPFQAKPSRPTPMPYSIASPPRERQIELARLRVDGDGSGLLSGRIVDERARAFIRVDLVVVVDRRGVGRIGVGRQSRDAGSAARMEALGRRRPLLVVEIVVVIAPRARAPRRFVIIIVSRGAAIAALLLAGIAATRWIGRIGLIIIILRDGGMAPRKERAERETEDKRTHRRHWRAVRSLDEPLFVAANGGEMMGLPRRPGQPKACASRDERSFC